MVGARTDNERVAFNLARVAELTSHSVKHTTAIGNW